MPSHRVGFSPPLLFFVLIFGAARQPTHVPVLFRPPSWRSGHFLLLVQEKVTKENTPSVPRPARSAGCAAGGRSLPTGHPWPAAKAARSLAPPARCAALSVRPS